MALYHARSNVNGYNVKDALSYTWAIQAMIMVVLPFTWVDLMQTIRSGEVVTDLSKPCDFFLYWFSREMGRNCYYALFRAIPTYLAGALLFGLPLGANPGVWPGFLLCLLLGSMNGTTFRIFLNLPAFWIIEVRSLVLLGITLALFFTGSYIPVIFFPDWLARLSMWLPFSEMMNAPAQVLLGKVYGIALLNMLATQLGWLLLMAVVTRLITAIATRKVEIQGG
jgi:ABC-2 type transport system permease protein